MSTDAGGGAPKKPSTAEILARARAQAQAKAAGEAAESAPAPEAPAAETPAAPETPAAAPAADKPKPKSTADILAAARAQAAAKAAGGAAPATPAAAAPAAGGAAKPKSTADILAAARAQAAAKAAGEAPAAATPAAAAPAKPAAKPAAATGPKPSVAEMLAAVRAGESPAAATAAKPAAPPVPQKPQPAAKKGATVAPRRGFLRSAATIVATPFALGWTSLATASAASVLGVLRFMLPNVLTEPPSKFKVGPPADYDLGTVSEKWKAQFGIWIVHTDRYQGKNLVYALASICTHLGCTPSWLEGEQKFKCPCHGSGFYINGINFEGPAPRPLERYGIRLAEDGMLEVDKSVKFQEELGQWKDPASFVEIG